jgi:predicted Zn-dependent protease
VQLALGRAAEAEASLARAVELGDTELATLLLLGQTQMIRADWPRAVATFERACAQSPEAAQAWTELAEAQARAGDAQAAELSLAEATRRNAGAKRVAAVRRLLAEQGKEAR